jgi:hypothetical protein
MLNLIDPFVPFINSYLFIILCYLCGSSHTTALHKAPDQAITGGSKSCVDTWISLRK